ncbi:NAD(P)-dependent oxidoreductase [Catellatospora chokoriensis]|uniref:Adenosylhomocysteinase n=1 Tax=Catellatospora chokoriensis TaxID=310353 RepID=A0A8J3KF64_9ACTN|nr:NAD(P)-dependent oxidoreductase [Catellatospora chokoriensis]GIF94774.1 adenosylhomocysteinase [Catellatospora chokoriensis]
MSQPSQAPTAWQAVPLDERIAWARHNMVLTARAAAALPPLHGVRLACTVHLDLKILLAIEAFARAGAQVAVVPANPHTTQWDVVGWLHAEGVETAFTRFADEERAAAACVEWAPTHALEMGAVVMTTAARAGYTGLSAGVEVTRTGVDRLFRVEVRHPVFDLDAVPLKTVLHNRFAVGTSTWATLTARTNVTLHAKSVLVVGYGEVGAGLARTARANGAQVLVAEPDPSRRAVASYEGYRVGTADELITDADVVVTATGRPGSLPARLFARAKDGCLLLNSGHTDDEIEVDALGPGRPVIPHLTAHRYGDRELFLFAGGRIANLVAGDGDSLNVFDTTEALMIASLAWTITEGSTYPPGLHPLPTTAWRPATP